MADPIQVLPPPLEIPIQTDKGGNKIPLRWQRFLLSIQAAGQALGSLADLAAQTGLGFATRISTASQWRLRTFLAGSGIAISNPAGTAGDPTWSVTGLLLALFNLATTGYLVRTGAGTVAARTFQAGTGISISNPDGVAGNSTITNTAPGSGGTVTNTGTLTLDSVIVGNGGVDVKAVTAGAVAAAARTSLGVAIGTDVEAWAAILDAVAALAVTGFIARTGAGTVAARTFSGGANIGVSNGNGVAGDPDVTYIPTDQFTAVTGTHNDYTPGLSGHTTEFWSGASDATFTGLVGGVEGFWYTFKNVGTSVAYFANQSGGSSAGNLFSNLITSGVTPVAAGGWISYVYDGTDWQLVAHNQGAWIDVTFSAGDFTGNGAMTWTVAGAGVSLRSYFVNGLTLEYAISVNTSTVGGTPNTELRVALPNGWTSTQSQLAIIQTSGSGGGNTASLGGPVSGQAYVRAFSDFTGTNWPAGGAIVREVFSFPLL